MNYYVNKMREIEAKYKGKFKNIIELMNIEVEKAQMFREDLKIDTLNFLVEEAKKEVEQLKKKYFEECEKVLQETMPIPKATNYTELDLKLMKLNMLASKDEENIDNLKNILNPQDFNINKGQLLEIALLKNTSYLMNKLSNIKISEAEFYGEAPCIEFNIKKTNSDDFISKISNLKVLTEEDFRTKARGVVGQRINNNDFVPGIDIGYQIEIEKEGLNNYIDILAGIVEVDKSLNSVGFLDNEIDYESPKEYRELTKAECEEIANAENLFNTLGYVDGETNFESPKEYRQGASKGLARHI